jgi:hypothetical protein
MEDEEIFDMLFDSVTKNWEQSLRERCAHEYSTFRTECENFESILKSVIENKDLEQQVQNEIKKRLGS